MITRGKIHNNEILLKEHFKSKPIVWISKFKARNLSKSSAPICITKNAFKQNYPFENLYVSPNHAILVNGKMVRAKNLVNDDTIFQDFSYDSVVYYHLELDNHSAVIANGILSETYLDVNNRYIFESSKPIINLRKMTLHR